LKARIGEPLLAFHYHGKSHNSLISLSLAFMLDVEYAQLADGLQSRDPKHCFASVTPRSPEQTRTHGWLFAITDQIGSEGTRESPRAVALEIVSSGFRSASPYEVQRALLPRLIQQANAKLLRDVRKPESQIAVLACTLRSDTVVICHVGDLRCYLVRRGHAELLTRDHTVTNDQRRLGLVPNRDAVRTESRQQLARSLGSEVFVAVDIAERQLIAGDVLLACSYGLYSRLPETDIELIISDNRKLDIAARELISAAAKNNETAFMGVQLIRIEDIERRRAES
jgi:protein phosphatase